MDAADLVIRLAAQTDQFERGMKGAQRILASVGSAVATLAGTAAIGVFTKQTLDTVDAAGKLAARIGTTTESLTALQYAAGLADIETGTFAASMERLNRFMATAGGSKEAQAALAKLGLSLKQLSGMDATQALLAISDGLSRIDNAGQRAALIAQIFGRSATDMANLLSGGSAAIREMMQEASRYGQVFTDEQAAMADSINDNMTRIQTAFKGAFQQVLLASTPIIEKFMNIVTRLISASSSWLPLIIKIAAGLGAVYLAVRTVNAAIAAYTVIQKAATTAAIIFQAIAAGPAGWVKIAAGVAVAAGAIVLLNKTIDTSATAMDASSSANYQNAESLKAVTAAAQVLQTSVSPREMALRARSLDISQENPLDAYTEDSETRVKRYMDLWRDKLEKVKDAAAMPISPMQQHLNMIEDVNQAYERGLIPLERRNQLLRDLITKQQSDAQQAAMQKARDVRNEFMRRGAAVRDSVMTPIERMKQQIAELKRLRSVGAIDQTTFQRAVQAEFDKAKESKSETKQSATQFAGAQKAGSAEAWRTILSASSRQKQKKTDGEKEIVTNLKDLVRAVRETGVESVIRIG